MLFSKELTRRCCSPRNSPNLSRELFCCEERWEDFSNSMHWVHLHKHVSKGTIWGCSMHEEHTPVFCRWPYPCQRGCCHILETITTYNCPNAKPSSIKRSKTKNGTSKLIEKGFSKNKNHLFVNMKRDSNWMHNWLKDSIHWRNTKKGKEREWIIDNGATGRKEQGNKCFLQALKVFEFLPEHPIQGNCDLCSRQDLHLTSCSIVEL